MQVTLEVWNAAERSVLNQALDQIDALRKVVQWSQAAPIESDTTTPVEADVKPRTRRPRPKPEDIMKKLETTVVEVPQEPTPAPVPLEGEDVAPMRPQTHGGALKSGGGAPAPKAPIVEVTTKLVDVPTVEMARPLLQKYAEQNGLDAASKLLRAHGANRIGDVASIHMTRFIQALEAGITA